MATLSPRIIRRSCVISHILFAGYLFLLLYLALFYSVLPKCTSLLLLQLKNALCPFHLSGFIVFCVVELIWTIYAFYLSLICHRWTAREIKYELFDACEHTFAIIRTEFYISLFATLFLVIIDTDLHNSRKVGILVSLHVLPLGICIYHTLFRKTFREWPNYILTLSVCFEYVSWAIMTYPNDMILGFIDGSIYVNMVSQITPYLASGTILTTLAAMVFESAKEKYNSELEKDNTPDSTNKRTRFKLLMHTPTHPGRLSSTFSKVSWAILLYMLICCGSVLLPLTVLSDNSVPPPASSAQSEELILSVELPSLSFYVGTLGLCTGVMGIASHFTISDESILKSEYSYIYFRARKIKKEDFVNQSDKWKDYCQVTSNIYCAHSNVISDNHYFHHLWKPALQQLKEQHQLCDSKFLADIAYIQLEANKIPTFPNADLHIPDNHCMAVDTIEFLKTDIKTHNPPNLINTLCFAANLFFTSHFEWERRFRATPYTFEESVSILLYDMLNLLLHQKSPVTSNCRAAEFCSKCLHQINPDHNTDAVVRRAELLLSFPLLIRKCMNMRWKGVDINIPDDIHTYYTNLVNNPFEGISDLNILDTIHSHWINSVHTLLNDQATTFLNAPLSCVCRQVQTQSLRNPDYPQSKRIRNAQELIVENPTTQSIHTAFTDNADLQDYSRRLVFYVFYDDQEQSSSPGVPGHGIHAEVAPV